MRSAIVVSSLNAGLAFMGTRQGAKELREKIEALFREGATEVVLDFTGLKISQSFADELVGVLVVRQSPEILERLIFKGCNDSVRAVLDFVVADRYDEFVQTKSH